MKHYHLLLLNERWDSFWIGYCCRGRTKIFRLHYCRERTEVFTVANAFFLFVCLMGWNTLVWFVCIWICSGESQFIISLNLDWDIWFGFLGLSFFFFSFLWISGLVFFIRVCVLLFCFWMSGLVSESGSFRHIVQFFLKNLYVLVFKGVIFPNMSTPG